MAMERAGKATVVVVAALVVVAVGLLAVRTAREGDVGAGTPATAEDPSASRASTAKVSELAPDFVLMGPGGTETRLSDQRGKVVLIDFWATWCPPCREELPHIQRLHDTYRSDGLVVLALSTDRDPAAVVSFVSRNGFTFPVLFANPEVARTYRVRGIPTVYLVDRQGTIRFHHVGYTRGAEKTLESEVVELLAGE